MKTIAGIRKELENLPETNQWEKAVNSYAIDMFDNLVNNGEIVFIRNIDMYDLLDGAKNWTEHSWNGHACTLCYEHDLRKIFDPNGDNSDGKAWLDIQAKALAQASKILIRVINEDGYTVNDVTPTGKLISKNVSKEHLCKIMIKNFIPQLYAGENPYQLMYKNYGSIF